MNALDALQTYAETCLLMHVCRWRFLCQRENAPTWSYKPGIQAMKSSSTRWVPRNWQNAKKGRKEHQKGWNLNPNLYSPACGIRDLSFQPLFCYFLYSKQFWLKSFKCPKERKVGASLYSSTLSPFSDMWLQYMWLLQMQPLFLPRKLSQLGTQQSAMPYAHAYLLNSMWAGSSTHLGNIRSP